MQQYYQERRRGRSQGAGVNDDIRGLISRVSTRNRLTSARDQVRFASDLAEQVTPGQPEDSPSLLRRFLRPLITPEMVRQLPGWAQPIGNVGRELTSPSQLALMAATAGIGPLVAGGIRGTGLAANVARGALSPLVRGGFGARLGAEAALQGMATAGSMGAAHLTRNAPTPVRVAAPILGGLAAGAGGLAGLRAGARALPEALVRVPQQQVQEAGLRLAGAKPVAGAGELVGDIPALQRHPQITGMNVEAFSNLLESQPFREHGLSGLDVPSQGVMVATMFKALQNPEIRQSVIKSVPVKVMDILVGAESPAKILLHDKAVLRNVVAVNLDGTVSLRVDVADALVRSLAKTIAEVPAIRGVNPRRLTRPKAITETTPGLQHEPIIRRTGAEVEPVTKRRVPARGAIVPSRQAEIATEGMNPLTTDEMAVLSQGNPQIRVNRYISTGSHITFWGEGDSISISFSGSPGVGGLRRIAYLVNQVRDEFPDMPIITIGRDKRRNDVYLRAGFVRDRKGEALGRSVLTLPPGRRLRTAGYRPVETPVAAERAAEIPVTAVEPPVSAEPPPATGERTAEELSSLPAAAPPAGRPPRQMPPATGAEPPGPTPSIKAHLAQAEAIVARDKPGLITRVLDYVPVAKQVQRGVHPSLGMNEKVLVPWVAEGNVLSTVGTRLSQERIPIVTRLKEVFGEGVVKGTEKSKIRFIGTAEEAKYPFIGFLYDIAQNPHLYDLSPAERAVVQESESVLSRLYDEVKTEYGLDIGKFPTREGSMFLSNIEKPEVGTGLFETAVRSAKSGRAKTRFYPTGRERWAHDPTFNPITDVEQLLGGEMHDALTKMAGRSVYKTGLGGLDRMGALKATGHEALVKKMVGLRSRLQTLRGAAGRLDAKQQQAVDDFLRSSLEDADLASLRDDLEPAITRGVNAGMDVAALNKEVAGIRAQIRGLQPAWKSANAKGYQFVQEGIYRYFPDADAEQIRRLAQTSNNPLLRWVDNLRATAFGGDLSPVSIQMFTAWLSDPIGVSRALAKQGAAGSMWSEEGLLASLNADSQGWSRFTRGTGLSPLGGVDKEFAVGLVGKVPGIGKPWTQFNESVYRPVMRLTKDIFDNSYQAATKRGFTEEQAIAIAADDATKIIPRVSSRRLGMSQAEAARYRAILTSVSFLTQPTALISDATKGFVKIGLKQSITPSEQFAVQRMSKLIAVTEALAVSSSVYYAQQHGQDPEQAAKEALDPTHPNFMSFKTPWGARIGIGGPFRSLIRAAVPRAIPGSPVPVPFAGLERFAEGKIGPTLRSLYEISPYVNRDYMGRQIRTGDFPVNILQSMEHVIAGNAPLTGGTAYQALRRGQGLGTAAEEVAGQLAGTNYIPFDPIYDAKLRWDKDLKAYRNISANAADLGPRQRTRSQYRRLHPEIDAKLFILGDVTSLETGRAVREAMQLIKEGNIPVAEVRGVSQRKDHLQRARRSGRRTPHTRVDVLMALAGTR